MATIVLHSTYILYKLHALTYMLANIEYNDEYFYRLSKYLTLLQLHRRHHMTSSNTFETKYM